VILDHILLASGKEVEWIIIPKIILDGKGKPPDIIQRLDVFRAVLVAYRRTLQILSSCP